MISQLLFGGVSGDSSTYGHKLTTFCASVNHFQKSIFDLCFQVPALSPLTIAEFFMCRQLLTCCPLLQEIESDPNVGPLDPSRCAPPPPPKVACLSTFPA